MDRAIRFYHVVTGLKLVNADVRENSLIFKIEKIVAVDKRLFVVLFFLIVLLFFIVNLKFIAINFADIRFIKEAKNIILEFVILQFIYFLTFVKLFLL